MAQQIPLNASNKWRTFRAMPFGFTRRRSVFGQREWLERVELGPSTIRPSAAQAAGRSITTNNQPRQSGADIVAIALSFFKLSQSESGDAETKKREGGGLRRSR
jgi:hypothetical protein